jgi:hypothetical protein
MATFSKKMGGKEVGQASTYAKPHGVNAKQTKMVDPNSLSADSTNVYSPAKRVSMGNPAADDVKTSGIKIRGTGAATKGTMARGPMA